MWFISYHIQLNAQQIVLFFWWFLLGRTVSHVLHWPSDILTVTNVYELSWNVPGCQRMLSDVKWWSKTTTNKVPSKAGLSQHHDSTSLFSLVWWRTQLFSLDLGSLYMWHAVVLTHQLGLLSCESDIELSHSSSIMRYSWFRVWTMHV